MPRNSREGTHLPFAHRGLSNTSISLLIEQKMNLNASDMSKKHQFGEKLETPHPYEHLHTLNQIPQAN